MKKSPPTPDTNAGAPRPKHISDEDPSVPTMDTPPAAPSDTSTSFDRGTAATDQDYRSGLLPGSNDFTPDERTIDQADDESAEEFADEMRDRAPVEGVDSPADDEDMGEDLAGFEVREELEEPVDTSLQTDSTEGDASAAEPSGQRQTFPQQDNPDQEGVFEQPGRPNHEPVYEPGNDTLGAVHSPGADAATQSPDPGPQTQDSNVDEDAGHQQRLDPQPQSPRPRDPETGEPENARLLSGNRRSPNDRESKK